MRFLIAAAPDPNRKEPAPPPDEKVITAYMKFNEDMHRAGVLLASEGLFPGRQGARVGVSGGKRVTLDGPFAESKELVGGYYVIEVNSREEAIAWAMRCPVGDPSADLLTLHPLTDASDLPPEVLKIITDAAPTWSAAFAKKR